jgi:hypothetical protein
VAQLFSLGSMNTFAIKKWEGILSVIWSLLGFAFFWYRRDQLHFDSLAVFVLTVFVAWWGVSLLLAVSGLRSGSRVSVFGGCVTILGFLYFLWWAFVPRFHT